MNFEKIRENLKKPSCSKVELKWFHLAKNCHRNIYENNIRLIRRMLK